VAGRRWRISAASFFQGRPDGAEALVDAVLDALRPAGIAGGPPGGTEANGPAVADARINLTDLKGARVVRADVRRWRPSPASLMVADPSRHGLGAGVVARIGGTGASALALVSCDPGALGRDAGLLAAAGWRLGSVHLVDLFPHTAHIEVVTGWFRGI